MSYLDNLQQTTNKTFTENGAITNRSTLDPLLDFFSRAGAMRDRPEDAVTLFKKAYESNPLLAIRCLFYLRDIRGGQGERELFRKCVASLPLDVQTKLVRFVPEYGRYDDLLSFSQQDSLHEFIKLQLDTDYAKMQAGESISLLAKWLPSENTSSKKTRTAAKIMRDKLGFTAREYRVKLSALRKHINVLERQMSANEWSAVTYAKVPSQAHRKHTKAFKRHDEARYTEYISAVEKGEAEIKTSTLFTYEVFDMVKAGETSVANAMWNNLPDYTQGKSALVLADVSGSMSGRPMSISVSLALYFAERNKGTFQNYFMTFTSMPDLVKVQGTTLKDKLSFIESRDWGGSTNIQAAFDAILEAAVKDNTPQEDMPTVLYIISDMEFDSATESNRQSNFEIAKEAFEEKGYKLPHLVFWCVNSRNDQSPATKYDDRVTLISGSSQSTFRYVVEGKSPLESMMDILNGERYSQIVL